MLVSAPASLRRDAEVGAGGATRLRRPVDLLDFSGVRVVPVDLRRPDIIVRDGALLRSVLSKDNELHSSRQE